MVFISHLYLLETAQCTEIHEKKNSLFYPLLAFILSSFLDFKNNFEAILFVSKPLRQHSLSADYCLSCHWLAPDLCSQRDGSVILENVSPDGKELPGCQGRLTVPGHSFSLIVLSFRQFLKKAVCVIYSNSHRTPSQRCITMAYKSTWSVMNFMCDIY